MKHSLAWWCFANRCISPELLLKAAKEIGYDGVELAEPHYWQSIRDAGLDIVTIKGHESLTAGLNNHRNFPRLRTELVANIALAEQWRIPNLICFSGNRYGADDKTAAQITAENLRALAPFAERAGVTLLLELLNSKVDHLGYQCDRTAQGLEIIEMVASPNVRLLYDIYHMQIMEGDIIRTIQSYSSRFGHYHIAGNPGRGEPDDSQELNYSGIIHAIAMTGYTAYIGHEFLPKGNPVSALRRSLAVCTRYSQRA